MNENLDMILNPFSSENFDKELKLLMLKYTSLGVGTTVDVMLECIVYCTGAAILNRAPDMQVDPMLDEFKEEIKNIIDILIQDVKDNQINERN